MFEGEKALLQSRTFWAAVLSVVAVVAQQFHWAPLYAWAIDPASVTAALNAVAVIGGLAAIVFRALASRKVTSALPKTPT
jgi:uncharacterized membrane protein